MEGREVVGVLGGDSQEEMPLEREVVRGRGGIDGDGLAEGVVERGGGGDRVGAGRDVVEEVESC